MTLPYKPQTIKSKEYVVTKIIYFSFYYSNIIFFKRSEKYWQKNADYIYQAWINTLSALINTIWKKLLKKTII